MLGQICGEFKFTDGIFGAFGSKEYETPYINKNDVRMTPIAKGLRVSCVVYAVSLLACRVLPRIPKES